MLTDSPHRTMRGGTEFRVHLEEAERMSAKQYGMWDKFGNDEK